MKMRFFNLAEKLAEKSDHPTSNHGAVLVRKGKVLGLGFNRFKTHSRSNHPFKMIHAELSAILSSGLEDLSGCQLYVVRKRKNGELANSKPCQFCEKMLKLLQVDVVYYSTDNYFMKEVY
jgi:deoxycytidylate deaminase